MGRAAFALRPLHARLLEQLKQSTKLFADETTAPVLDPGRGRVKKGQLWAYARDERPWAGRAPPGVAYVYAPDRKHARPAKHLAGFSGILQVDGYGAYEDLAECGDVALAFLLEPCAAAILRYPGEDAGTDRHRALVRIAALYAIEADIRGRSVDERRQARQRRTKPLVDDLRLWLEARLAAVSGKSTIAVAIRYTLSRWDGLVRSSTTAASRSTPMWSSAPSARLHSGAKPSLRRLRRRRRAWAVIVSLIETCKMNAVDPQAHLRDVVAKIVSRHPMDRIDELLPFAYAVPPADSVAA